MSVQVLAGSGAAPGSCGQPAPTGARGPPAMGFFLSQMMRLNEIQPRFCSPLAFKQEETTDDNIGVGVSEESEKHLTRLFWENGIPLLISS